MGDFKVDADALTRIFDGDRPMEKIADLGDVEGIVSKLSVDPLKGLSMNEVEKYRKVFGENAIPQKPPKTLTALMLEALNDKTLVMLCIAAVVSLILGVRENPATGWIEGSAILFAVLIVVLVSSLNDYAKERQFRKLNAKKEDITLKVFRDSKVVEIPVHDLVVGDVLNIETGDILPADGLFLSGMNVVCDESSVTGESDAMKKNQEKPLLYSGAQCQEGFGRIVVCAVGVHSQYGQTMMKITDDTPSDTPLQIKLEALAEAIAKFGLGAASTILISLIVKFFIQLKMEGTAFELGMLSQMVRFLITAITLVVVAVPEGLPLAVTIALAFSMVKMMNENCLVRHMDATETMGGANMICSDKTGTLTENRMTVVRVYTQEQVFDDVMNVKDINSILLHGICQNCCVNSTAVRTKTEFVGSKTECAMLTFAEKMGFDYEKMRADFVPVTVFPFSSLKKRMSSVVSLESGEIRVVTKGASEIVLGCCDKFYNSEGKVFPLTDADRKDFTDTIHSFASSGLRTICVALRDLPVSTPLDDQDKLETEMTALCIVGIEDPVRATVPDAVEKCRRAGITVRMVTGDNATTAQKIATDCGIYTGGVVMEGPEFRALSAKQMAEIVPKLQVLARSSPTDKHTLVGFLKNRGDVVAVTGDGTNDAPSLKLSHVGLSMGIAGTEISKNASDIILLDDNFKSSVTAVLWGRNVYDSIRKFLQFQLTVNIVAVVTAFVGALTSADGESPLKPVQLLWVNLIMDTLAALALATEPPAESLLNQAPYGQDEPLLTKTMWKNVGGQSVFQLIVSFTMLYFGHILFDVEKDGIVHLTLIFNIFVLCQLFNEINSRKLFSEKNVFSGLQRAPLFLGVMIFTVVGQYIMVQFGGMFTSTAPLTMNQWIVCASIAALSIPIGFALSFFDVEPRETRAEAKRPLRIVGEHGDSALDRDSAWWKVRKVSRTKIQSVEAFKKGRLVNSIRRRRR